MRMSRGQFGLGPSRVKPPNGYAPTGHSALARSMSASGATRPPPGSSLSNTMPAYGSALCAHARPLFGFPSVIRLKRVDFVGRLVCRGPQTSGRPQRGRVSCRAARGVNGDRRFPSVNGRPPTSSGAAAAAAARGGGTPLVTFGAPREYATAAALRPASRSHARPPSSSQAATADSSGG
jgi:hypothetical protein